jgi:hypothetical protein
VNLLLTIAQSMGLDIQTFGEPDFCTGSIDAIKA